MVKSATLVASGLRTPLELEFSNGKTALKMPHSTSGSFDIHIEFDQQIASYRNHSHEWVSLGRENIATEFAPKILKLENGSFVQPSQQLGIWEISEKSLLWRFNPQNAAMLTVYRPPHNARILQKSSFAPLFDEPLALLFGSVAIEFSRSEFPFSAIACFTDHCDFDTAQNLVAQRELFGRAGIKVTKGFFRNHFSKRHDNASYQNDADEIEMWRRDGHELAYHSLTQSIRGKDEAIAEFRDFEAPPGVKTWIDHGYQPYNLSLYAANGISDVIFSETLQKKQIEILWNYIDSGTSAKGVINQLNPNDFTLGSFHRSQSRLGARAKAGLLIKNALFHFFADEKLISQYKNTAGEFKKLVYNKKIGSAWPFAKNLSRISVTLASVLLNWRRNKSKVYPLAKYAPLLFRHQIDGREFIVFQTIDMIDFKASLCRENLDKLVREKGVFIAHTYFSAPFSYHYGRMFAQSDKVQPEVESNFADLGQRVANREIWNPTLSQLTDHLSRFWQIRLDVSPDGQIIAKKDANLPYRKVS